MNERFAYTEYLIRKKVLALVGGEFQFFGPDQQLVLYSKMKAFKLREDIRIYSNPDMREELLLITARQIMDFSATYDVVDAITKEKVGALKRKGLKSMIIDEWQILDPNDREIGIIKEENLFLALVRRFATQLLPQTYDVIMGGHSVCRMKQNFNPFVMKIKVDFSDDMENQLDRRLGLAGALLLCAIEGRQHPG